MKGESSVYLQLPCQLRSEAKIRKENHFSTRNVKKEKKKEYPNWFELASRGYIFHHPHFFHGGVEGSERIGKLKTIRKENLGRETVVPRIKANSSWFFSRSLLPPWSLKHPSVFTLTPITPRGCARNQKPSPPLLALPSAHLLSFYSGTE